MAIQRELGTSLPESHDILLGLDFDPAAAGTQTDERAVRALEAARRELQGLARELVASLEFYQGQPDSLPISDILIAGGTSRIAGLAAELERLTRVHVRLADPLTRVAVGEAVDEREDIASLAVAIGLGVED
jgi:Tfp pilus assembly PilM family ATPase